MRRLGLLIAVLAATAALAAPAVALGGGNGYVLMVHGWFEPYLEGTPHAPGTVIGIRDADHVTFSAIPYATSTSRPAVVAQPRLEITGVGSGRSVTYAPNVDSENAVCRRETSFEGHEGPVAACPTFRVPAADLDPAVTMVLHFTDADGPQSEPLAVTVHQFIHGHLDFGVPADLATLDRDVDPEPFLVEQIVDPVP